MTRNFIVVGDIILDRFIYGNAMRISPEAPALVLDVVEEKHSIGGAFNVFSHLNSLGGSTKLISVTGSDIIKYLDDFPEINNHQNNLILFKDSSRVTSIKTRLIAFYKLSYLARFDKEVTKEINSEFVDKIIEAVKELLNEDSSLLIVDYKKGVVTEHLSEELIKIAEMKKVRVFVDTKKDDISSFKGAYVLKPNKIEFREIKLRYQLSEYNDIDACKILIDEFKLSNIVLTLGAQGIISVNELGQVISVPGNEVIIKELSGAGDSVLAVLAYLIHENYSMYEALDAANNIAASFISNGVTYRAKQGDLFKNVSK